MKLRTTPPIQTHLGCCPRAATAGVTRRTFLGGVGAALGTTTLIPPSWPTLAAQLPPSEALIRRSPLVVKPILVYEIPERKPQTSWRNWGGIQTPEQVREESVRIGSELAQLQKQVDFPLHILPVTSIRRASELEGMPGIAEAQALLVYAAGGRKEIYDRIGETGKDIVIFARHKSGPVYLWYEIISPRYLRQHQDSLGVKAVDFDDVVIDSQDEIVWRLRALCGLHNTRDSRILAIGGASAWAQPEGVVPDLVRKLWRLDIQSISYADLGKLIEEARRDQAAVKEARLASDAYLSLPGTRLETEKAYVDNAFLLRLVFLKLLKHTQARALTINSCMGTIMPMSQTTACLTLSLLNDEGYLAFCESDFVVIPSGLILANLSGKPVFLNDPTYPHDGIITLAHCTAPRKNDGKTMDPARIMTHFESDYGAAPKVDMRIGQVVTNIIPDFKSERWVGFLGKIVDNPNMDICRSQIDISYECDSGLLARNMPGFHWMTGYGDYVRELQYSLKKVPIGWECL